MAAPFVELEVEGRVVKVTNPDKIFYSARGETKLDHVNYYLSVGEGIVRALYERPTQLKRHPDGAEGEAIYQKRVPEKRPDWIETARVTFPSGRHADELCVTEVAQVAWAANLATIDFHPWPSRRAHVDNPDELRIDVDPQPGTTFAEAQAGRGGRARGARGDRLRRLAQDVGQPGHPRRLPDRAELDVPGGAPLRARVRARGRAALARLVTTAWWKEQRGERVFIDYNQNARDRTIASAYSVRARPDATVSAPVTWEELADVETEDFTLATMPKRFAALGDVQAGIDDAVCDLRVLLDWVERDEREGLAEAPYPPNFPKMPGEPKRVQPSRDTARKKRM